MYVVDCVGCTVLEDFTLTDPIPLLREAFVALRASHETVTAPPAGAVSGETAIEQVGAVTVLFPPPELPEPTVTAVEHAARSPVLLCTASVYVRE